jgi:hypothetical protein
MTLSSKARTLCSSQFSILQATKEQSHATVLAHLVVSDNYFTHAPVSVSFIPHMLRRP